MNNQKFKKSSLVFLGGANATKKYYKDLLKVYEKYFQIYFFDYGLDRVDEKFTADTRTYIKTLRKYITENLRDSNFFLLGASFGGFLAVKYARQHPDNIKGLLLLSPLTRLRSRGVVGSGLNLIKTEGEIYLSGTKSLVAPLFSIKNFNQLKQRYVHSKYVVNQMLNETDISEEIKILAICAENDRVVDTEYSKRLFEGKANVMLKTYNIGGHKLHTMQGTEILDIISTFTQNIDK